MDDWLYPTRPPLTKGRGRAAHPFFIPGVQAVSLRERILKNKIKTMKYPSALLVFVIVVWVVAPEWTQAGSGFYVSGEVGANFASGLDTTGTSNDRASWCDEYINPRYNEYERCTGPDRSVGGRWENEFDGATGILAGAAAGYSFAGQNPNSPLGGLRVELEYFYRQSNYNQTADIPLGVGTQGQKLRDEIVQATDRIGSMTSHNLFGNLFYDFSNTSRFTPYIGIGGGVGFTDMEYGSVWARNSDASAIATGETLMGQALRWPCLMLRWSNKTSPEQSASAKPRSATFSGGSRSCSGWITQLQKPRLWVSRDAGSGSVPSVTISSGTRFGAIRHIFGSQVQATANRCQAGSGPTISSFSASA